MSDATYSAHIGPDGVGAIEMVIRKAVPAGIDGPHGTIALDGLDLADAEEALRGRGYDLVSPWQLVRAYDGLRLETTIVRWQHN